jgi:hypothetical protein
VCCAGQAYRDEVTVLLLSGPPGMNKRELAERLIKEDAQQRYALPSVFAFLNPFFNHLVARSSKPKPHPPDGSLASPPSRLCSFAAPVWVTTRDPRPGEVDGEDVTFIEDFAFQVLKEQDRLLVSYQVCFLYIVC